MNTIVLDFSVDVTLRNSMTSNKHQIRLVMGNKVKNFGGGAPTGTIDIEGMGWIIRCETVIWTNRTIQ